MAGKVKVAVIGAGPAGLCALRHLLSSSPSTSRFIPVAFERNPRVGGVWLYTEDTSKLPLHSAVYDSMRTNLPKEIMAYEGFPFSSDLPAFIHHSDFLKYLESFKDHFNLEQYIRFNNEVTKVNPKPRPQDGESSFIDNVHWEVTSRDVVTGEERNDQFDAIIVCNGHYTVPYMNVTGLSNFKGRVLHSQKYRKPGPFKSEVVLVVGSASSGIDVALEVSSVAKQVYLSHRRSQKGIHSIKLPDNLEFVPGTSSIMDNGSVLLDNGGVLDGVDTIILSTGYEYDFPFLSEGCGITNHNHRIQPLYKHIFNISHPSMAFIGLNLRILPLCNFDGQMRFVAAVFSGRVTLPDKAAMLEDEERDYQEKLNDGLLPRDAHFLGVRQWSYLEDISRISNSFSFPKLWESIYTASGVISRRDVASYKDYKLVIIDEEKNLFEFVSS